MQNKNIDNNNTKTFFDALAMKATASFIQERITWDDWNMFLHYQVQFKHTIWQTILPWMSFQAWILAMEFTYVILCVFLVGCHPSD